METVYVYCVLTALVSIYFGIVIGYKTLCNGYSYAKAGKYAWRIPILLFVFPFLLVDCEEITKTKAIKKYLWLPHKCIFFAFLFENDFDERRKRSKQYPSRVLSRAHLIDRRF